MNTIWWFTFFYLVIRNAEPFQWAEVPRDGSIQYACAGETVHFPWSYTLSSGELLEDVQWFFQSQEGSSSSSSSSSSSGTISSSSSSSSGTISSSSSSSSSGTISSSSSSSSSGTISSSSSSSGTISSSSSGMRMMAVMTNGAFLPVPSFSQRVVNHRNNAGITMDRVVTKDSGNYSVVISGRGSTGNFFQYHRTIGLQVGSDLMTYDGYLHVQESPLAVQDTVTKRWNLELQCGTFTYLGQPPFDVEWITPAMVILGSSRFEHGQFKLWLTQPVLGGSYTCRIPVHLTHTACLSGNATARGQATYHLDATLARLTLLEAHQNALQKENDLLQNENAQLRAYALNLNDREIKLEALAYQRVIFHGHGLRNTHLAQGSALIVDNVVINQGQGYNGSTGTFTAPLNGTYFFIGTTGSWSSSQASQFSLIVDGQVIAFVSTRTQGPLEAVSVHGISHLRVGQQAWLGISYGVEFSSEVTSFSGYMISVDP